MQRLARLVPALLVILAGLAAAQKTSQVDPPDPIEPLNGSLVLAGGGELPVGVFQAFARLAGGGAGRLVLVGHKRDQLQERRWKDLGVASVRALRIASKSQLRSEKVLIPLLEATGIWIASDVPALRGSDLFERLLRSAVDRGGVVGGTDTGARVLAAVGTPKGKRAAASGFDLLPRAVVMVRFDPDDDDARLLDALGDNPGCVGWGIPEATALVVHHGRRVGVVGKHAVTARIAPRGAWPGRIKQVEPREYVQRWDRLPYGADLLAWTRSARARCGPLFPPKSAPVPEVPTGTLFLSGGGGVDDETFSRFIAAAGGKDATFVCIPTAFEMDEDDKSNSSSAKALRKRGCTNVHVVHTRIRSKADRDPEFLAPLKSANAVWMDGGRTYRLMDAYQHTEAHRLMAEILGRGGVIGGSSAGCQVQGDFLMRGKPSSNRPLWWEGYETGFGFLRGVIIDAHFRQRKREEPFAGLMDRFPQMLGIGVDEETTLVVKGHVAEVVGGNAVTFFDHRNEKRKALVLRAGERYDLKSRAPIK